MKTEDFDHFKKLNDCDNLLSVFELERFRRYKHASDAHNFFIARYVVRQQLKIRLKCDTKLIDIKLSSQGKPYLNGYAKCPYHFSIAHCKGFVLVAIAKYEIGVDIERIDRISNPRSKTKKLINEHVGRIISELEDYVVQESAMQYWTGLEAYVKFMGTAIASERASFAKNTTFPLAVWNNVSFVFGRFDFAIWSVVKKGLPADTKLTVLDH